MIESIPTIVTLVGSGIGLLIVIMLASKYLPSGWLRNSLEDTTPKHALLIQIQPELIKGFNPKATKKLLIIAKDRCKGTLTWHVDQGNDNGEYRNITWETKHIKSLWAILSRHILHNDSLHKCVIVTCTGKDGWNDYLQLYHYDKSQKLDTL